MALSPNALFGYFDRDPKYAKTLEILRRLQEEHPDKFEGLLNQPDRLQQWVEQIDSGTRDDASTAADIDKYIIAGATPTNQVDPGGTQGTEEEEPSGGGFGAGELTILTGEDMKWHFDRKSGKWMVSYGLPGSGRRLVFEAETQDMDKIFGTGMRPQDYEVVDTREFLGRDGVTFGGDVLEMTGTGSFEGEMERVIALAMDEGKLPDWADESDEIMDILFIAQSEGKDMAWTVRQISDTQSFKERFPGIDKMMKEGGMDLSEAIPAFLEYEAGVNAAMKAAGLEHEVTPDIISGLIDAGHSLTVINSTVAGYNRMQNYKPALDAFNEVLAANGMDTITSIDDMLDFVAGRSSSEVYDLYEASSIQEAAVGAGLGGVFSVDDAMNTAYATNQTLESATAGMQKAAEFLLRMRHEVNMGSLTESELIDINLGVTPRSGRSTAEIHESINRAVSSAQGDLLKRAQSAKSYGSGGTPQAVSLRRARQES